MSINRKLAIHIFIKGRVQGVSFCYFTLKQAQNLNAEDWYGIVQRGMWRLLPRGIKQTWSYLLKYNNRGHPFIGWMK